MNRRPFKRSWLYLRATLAWGILILAAAAGVAWWVMPHQPETAEAYEQLMLETLPGLDNAHETSHQKIGVERHLQLSGEDQRAIWLKAERGEVRLTTEGSRTEAIEELENVIGMVQDRIDMVNSTQQIRAFKAKRATYSSADDLLVAYDVLMRTYTLPGANLPGAMPSPANAEQTTKAKRVQFHLFASEHALQATHLRMERHAK